MWLKKLFVQYKFYVRIHKKVQVQSIVIQTTKFHAFGSKEFWDTYGIRIPYSCCKNGISTIKRVVFYQKMATTGCVTSTVTTVVRGWQLKWHTLYI